MTTATQQDIQFLEKLCETALEKCAGDSEAALHFVEAFIKEAAAGATNTSTMGGMVMKGFTEGFGKSLGGLVIGTGLAAFGSALGLAERGALHTRFLSALERAMTLNQVLKDAASSGKTDKIKNYAETVFKFAPNVSTDPNVLAGILANAIHGEGIDVMTIKTLGDLENKFIENRSFNPKMYT